jgi:hypothetical protein
VLACLSDNVELVADVDQNGSVAGDEKDVARKSLLSSREILNHTRDNPRRRLVNVGCASVVEAVSSPSDPQGYV